MKWHSSFSLQKTAYNISGCAFLSGKQNVFHQKFLEMIHINQYFKSSYTSLIEIIENQGMSVIFNYHALLQRKSFHKLKFLYQNNNQQFLWSKKCPVNQV